MEEQLEMQERLITLKDEQIAALQDALQQAGEDAGAGIDVQEGTIESLDMSGLEPEPEAEPGEPAAPESAPEAQAAPEPEPKPAPPPPPPPEPTIVDLIMENIIYVGAGAVALLLLLVLLLRRKSSRGSDDGLPFATAGGDEDDFADVSLSEDSLLVDEFDEEEEEQQVREDRPEPVSAFSSSDDDAYAAQFETGDALAEADIYIAYGRFPQAVDLLKAAIAVEPANTDYRIKLMEACVEMVESGEFQQQYADLQVIGDDNVLQRARALLEAVDGGEAWLEDLPEPSISQEDVEGASQATAAARPPETDFSGEMPDLELEPELDTSDELDLGEDSLGGLEDDDGLELDLDDTDIGVDVERELSGSDDDGVDFDLDEEPEEEEPEEIDLEPAMEAEDSGDELGEVELPDLEYEDLSGDTEEDDFGTSGESSEEDLLADLDELDLGLEDEPEEEPEDSITVDDEGDLELSDLASDLEIEEEPAAAEPDAADLEAMADELVNGSELDGAELDSGDDSDDDLASMELDMSSDGSPEEEGLVFAADGDEIATKLDLARAYIDMGDEEGARGILEEVLEGGNENQQQEARSLLEGIG